MGFTETVMAAALGASIPQLANWAIQTWATNRWKRRTPAGQGYTRMEGLVDEILTRVPGPDALRHKDRR